MATNSDADRWRKQLDEAENELTSANEKFEQLEKKVCSVVNKLISLIEDEGEQYKSVLTQIKTSVENGFDFRAFETAMTQLTNNLVREEVAKKPSVNDSATTQVCALMISEVLLQLVDSVSLPISVTARIDKIKQGLEKGLDAGAWGSMLEEVVDMAADIRLKINTERQDTEVFLQQVTTRLQDLDGFMLGSKERREISRERGEMLNDAVKMEMQEIESSVQEAREIRVLQEQIQKRLNAIEQHFSSFHEGELIHHGQEDELVKRLSERLTELEAETHTLREKIQTEREQALQDALTGVPNRLAYDGRIKEELERWRRFKNPLSLVMIDIDHFKRINDNYGHAAGDKALKVIAKLLAQKTRKTDYLARYGGEEFVLIMPGVSAETAKLTVDKLRVFVESSGFHFKGEPVTITVSCGISDFCEGDSSENVFERADKALYQAKNAGRNQVVVVKK